MGDALRYVSVSVLRDTIDRVFHWATSYSAAADDAEREREAAAVARAAAVLAGMTCKRATPRDRERQAQALERASFIAAAVAQHREDNAPSLAASAPCTECGLAITDPVHRGWGPCKGARSGTKPLPFGYDVEHIIAAADAHAADYGADPNDPDDGNAHAIGDLAAVLRAAWRVLTPQQKRTVAAHDAVRALRGWFDLA